MNDENKKLISQIKLFEIMYEYLKSELDKCKEDGGAWHSGSLAGAFAWSLHSGVGTRTRDIGSRLCDNHFEIYNDRYEFVNIIVYKDHIEFIEDSKFNDFNREFMYELYMKIKKVIEGSPFGLFDKDVMNALYSEIKSSDENDIQNNIIANDDNIPESVIIDWINFLIRNDLLNQVMSSSYMDYFYDKICDKINSNVIDKGYIDQSVVEKLIKQLENNDD